MAVPIYADRVQETFTTAGAGTIALAGAVVGYQSFSAVLADAATCYYAATDGTNWEVGLGTYTVAGDTLARTIILASSNSGAAVSWAAGIKNIWLNSPAIAAVTVKSPTTTSLLSSSGTYTVPAGVKWLRVRMVGGGGGGAGAGSGQSDGTPGGNTTFGSSFLTCNGGGQGKASNDPIAGGTATIGGGATGIALQGASGGHNPGGASLPGAAGGVSPLGGAGSAGGVTAAGSNAIANTGSGGGSAGDTISGFSASSGSAGGYIDAIIQAPAASYVYVVGTAGTGGGGPYTGGNGSTGAIYIEEHYNY